jgi:hypothetical protein
MYGSTHVEFKTVGYTAQWDVTNEVYGLFDLKRAPSGSSLTIGGFAGCSATVLGAGSCPGF